MDCASVWVYLMWFGDEAEVLGPGRTPSEVGARVPPVRVPDCHCPGETGFVPMDWNWAQGPDVCVVWGHSTTPGFLLWEDLRACYPVGFFPLADEDTWHLEGFRLPCTGSEAEWGPGACVSGHFLHTRTLPGTLQGQRCPQVLGDLNPLIELVSSQRWPASFRSL